MHWLRCYASMLSLYSQTSLARNASRPQRLRPLSNPLVFKVSSACRSAQLSTTVADMSAAVRKNRYVVLPVDFEEAWKVSCLAVFVPLARRLYEAQIFLFLLFSSKTSNVRTRLWISVCAIPWKALSCSHYLLISPPDR